MPGQRQLSTLLNSQLTLHIYAATKGLGGAPKLTLPPGAGSPRYATDSTVIALSENNSSIVVRVRLVYGYVFRKTSGSFSFGYLGWVVLQKTVTNH